MKKSLFCFVLVLTLMSSLLCVTAFAAGTDNDEEITEYKSGDYKYALIKDGEMLAKEDVNISDTDVSAVITEYCGDDPKLTIPAALDGYEVTHIGDKAFSDCDFLTKVLLPESLVHIGDDAFLYCYSLTEISIPDSVASIGANPFSTCTGLKKISVSPEHPSFAIVDGILYEKAEKKLICCSPGSGKTRVEIPQGIVVIGEDAFCWCGELTEVIIPDSVTHIYDGAFFDCNSLAEIIIPDSVTHIGDSVFCYCSSLKEITIPDSVVSVGRNPFEKCTSLKKISVSAEHPVLAVTDGFLYEKSEKILICSMPGATTGSVKIPQDILVIGEDAFSACSSLTKVTIPDGVTSINDGAFSLCRSLKEISIPESVNHIGDLAFYSCESLREIVIPKSVTSIGEMCFDGCEALTNIILPESLTLIGENAFNYCRTLEEIVIPDNVTQIGSGAFSFCHLLEKAVIPDSVTYIGDNAFLGCSDNLVLTVGWDSYAAKWAEEEGIAYEYADPSDALDWLEE